MTSGVYKHKKHQGFQKNHKSFFTELSIKKERDAHLGEKSYNWKGENAKLSAKHQSIENILGKPKYCEHCKRTDKKKYCWSNKNHKYSRDINDWQRLCYSCHKEYDKKFMKIYKIKCIVCKGTYNSYVKKSIYCSKKCSNKYWGSINKLNNYYGKKSSV
jgi:hypothetical protein